jgi:hypothetical protein
MPNWCYNFVLFACPDKEMYKKLTLSLMDDAWFETFAPLGLDLDKFPDGWEYTKALETWGTKWGPSELEVLSDDDENFLLKVGFSTAWGPPQGVYKKMFEDFNIESTTFYYETGCEFFGWSKYNKEISFDESYTLPSNKKELEKIQKEIAPELNDFMEPTWEALQEQWLEDDESDEEMDE